VCMHRCKRITRQVKNYSVKKRYVMCYHLRRFVIIVESMKKCLVKTCDKIQIRRNVIMWLVILEPRDYTSYKMSMPGDEGVTVEFPPLSQRKGKKLCTILQLRLSPLAGIVLVMMTVMHGYNRYRE
jgi:hypothetical protein